MEKSHIKKTSLVSVRKASERDLPLLSDFLATENLPVSDLGTHIHLFMWEMEGKSVAGIGGWEQYESIGLLRSVVVLPHLRGTGAGRKWVQWLMDAAQNQGIQHAYLLTTTAAAFFEKMGFAEIDRLEVPESIQQTTEFSSLCPSTAVVMYRALSA